MDPAVYLVNVVALSLRSNKWCFITENCGVAANFMRDEGIDLLKDKQALQCLAETAEKAKMELSSVTQTNIRVAKLSFSDLDEVILVGGSTCIPAVQELVKKMTRKAPNVTSTRIVS
ncbi:hypothetical protein Ancab_013455 [Ancistrocladus abbreviatus]